MLFGAALASAGGIAGLTASGALAPSVAGATNPPGLNCGTLEINGASSGPFQFTEFTTGNATRSSSDSGGGAAYGGNLTASNFTIGQGPGFTIPKSQGGSETGQVNMQAGSAVVAGTAGGPINMNSGGTDQNGVGAAGLPFSFSTVGSQLAACSTNYGPNSATATGTVAGVGFSSPFTAVLGFFGTGSVNVFTVTADQLAAAQRLDFSVPPGSTNLIDVTFSSDHPTSLNLTSLSSGIFYGCPSNAPTPANWSNGNCGTQPSAGDNTSATGQERDDTVWNFSPSLFPSNYALSFVSWQGTVVAPNAAVTLSSGQFDGSVFAASLSGGEQTNFDPFGSGEPIPSGVAPLPALPEGLPIALGGLGLLSLGGLLLHRRRQQRHTAEPEGPTALVAG
jgi:choice-of-anchor A domain-containing protein/MYXO-CTERM domain-containing protein